MSDLQGSEIQDFAAIHAPIAPLSWSLVAELPGSAEETGDVPVRFTRPIELLGDCGRSSRQIPARRSIGRSAGEGYRRFADFGQYRYS